MDGGIALIDGESRVRIARVRIVRGNRGRRRIRSAVAAIASEGVGRIQRRIIEPDPGVAGPTGYGRGFRDVAVKVATRPGGYTRILKTGNRLGDNAEMCFIELVDYNEFLLGETKTAAAAKPKATRRSRGAKASGVKADADATVVEETTSEATETKKPKAAAKAKAPAKEKAEKAEKAPAKPKAKKKEDKE